MEVYKHRFHKVFDDSEALASIREADVIVAYEQVSPEPTMKSKAAADAGGGSSKASRRGKTGAALDAAGDEEELLGPADDDDDLDELSPNGAAGARSPASRGVDGEDSGADEADGGDGDLEGDDPDMEPNGDGAKESGEPEWPSKLSELDVGVRVDALDHRDQWFSGTVVAIDEGGCRCVHFDRFSSKWDEWYTEVDWRAGKLAPPNTCSKLRPRMLDIYIVQRRGASEPRGEDADGHQSRGGYVAGNASGRAAHHSRGGARNSAGGAGERGGGGGKELFALPFIVRCPSDKPCKYVHRLIALQALRFVPREQRVAALGERGGLYGTLPFTVRLISISNPLAPSPPATSGGGAAGGGDDGTGGAGGGSARAAAAGRPGTLLATPMQPIGEVFNEKRMLVALDWGDGLGAEDAATTESAVAFAERVTRPLADVSVRQHDEAAAADTQRDGVPLDACLNAHFKEETLEEEEGWYCPRCKTHRRATSSIEPWKLPDILVIHVKRFLCSARWREKIRSTVNFPLSALDMSQWVHEESRRTMRGMMTYDLFAVANHLGGMTGGHYTAFAKAVPCARDGAEEVASSFPCDSNVDGFQWLHFDDDVVEEINPSQLVTNSAYVLFYRRRRLTPSNVINLTV